MHSLPRPLIDQFDFCPYTPQVLEQCALITLGDLGLLTEFSTSQLNTWILEIWGEQQADGGFGTCFTPNSTIVETFFAINALKDLYSAFNANMPNFMINAVNGFLLAHQSKDTRGFPYPLFGCFFDNSSYLGLGFADFIVDWYSVPHHCFVRIKSIPIQPQFCDFCDRQGIYCPNSADLCG